MNGRRDSGEIAWEDTKAIIDSNNDMDHMIVQMAIACKKGNECVKYCSESLVS